MIETWIAEKWLVDHLTADPDLMAAVGSRIYANIAPPGVAFPYIVFSQQSNRDVTTINGTRMFNAATYQVKAVCEGASYAPIVELAGRIDAQLHRQPGPADDGTVLSAQRTEIVQYAELTDGQQYRHLGGLYRLQVQAG